MLTKLLVFLLLEMKARCMMKYIALLRGINISGKNKISMSELKKEFELYGYQNVRTYLNSGNVIFTTDIDNELDITKNIHTMIKTKFHLNIPIYIIKVSELQELLDHRPNWWGSDHKDIYDNIIFIISPYTYDEVYRVLGKPKEGLERIQEYKNNIFWSYNLKDYRRTNWWAKTANTSICNVITIRTANTVKKLLEICNE